VNTKKVVSFNIITGQMKEMSQRKNPQACCHSVKLCALAARALRSEQ